VAKLLIGSKKVRRCKNGTDLLYHRAEYGRDRGSHAGCRRHSGMFFFFLISLSRFRIMEFVKTETLSASSAIFKTVMVPLHR